MQIPIRNLYVMLCYAWDVLDPSDAAVTSTESGPGAENLLGALLLFVLRPVLRRGLHREYSTRSEEGALPRGRILFSESVARLSMARGQLVAEVSELQVDTPANQQIKAGFSRLLTVRTLDSRLRDELAMVRSALRDVADAPLSPSALARISAHRNAPAYRFLLSLVELIASNSTPLEGGGAFAIRDFTRDERQMRALFQKFVFNFYKREQREYAVSAPSFPWADSEAVDGAQPLRLPRMSTDVVLDSADRRLVIDTKFTARSFTEWRSSPSARSEHMYQLFSYLQNCPRTSTQGVDAVLLYPSTDGPLIDSSWRVRGGTMSVRSIDLRASWQGVKKSLLNLALNPAVPGH